MGKGIAVESQSRNSLRRGSLQDVKGEREETSVPVDSLGKCGSVVDE